MPLSNRLLAALPAEDLASLEPHLEALDLRLRHCLARAGQPIEHVYFLESGIASVVARRAPDRHIEVGLFGREGMGGLPLLLGSDRSPHDQYMQVAGKGHRMRADTFLGIVAESAALHRRLLHFVHVFLVQTAQTALANGSFRTNQRLARWLLMCADRIDGSVIPITHEFLAMMLGVGRPRVTAALHVLEGQGLVRAVNRRITIRNRTGLEQTAGASYGVPEAEYGRLLGPM